MMSESTHQSAVESTCCTSAASKSPFRRRRTDQMIAAATFATSLIVGGPANVHSFSASLTTNNNRRSHHRGMRTSTSTHHHPTKQLGMYKDFESEAAADAASKLSSLSKSASAASPQAAPSSFEERMRSRFLQSSTRTTKSTKTSSKLPPNIVTITNLSDYKQTVTQSLDTMLVVRFYAKWCRSCKEIAPAFYKLAKLNPDITFVEVPIQEDNANLHQGLGVPSIPYAHIYYKGVLVEEMKISRKRFRSFAAKVGMYSKGECRMEDDGNGSVTATCPEEEQEE